MPVWLQLLSRSRHFGDFPTCGKTRLQIVPEKAQLHARSMSALRETSFDGILFDDQKMHDLSGLLDVLALYGLPPVLTSVKDHAEEKLSL